MIYAIDRETKEHRICQPEFSDHMLQPAIMVNADERTVEADADGWIKHDGRECPLPIETETQVRYRYDGSESFILRASSIHWPEVMAYRPVYPEKREVPVWGGEGERPPVGTRCRKGHMEVLILAYADVGSPVGPAIIYQSIEKPSDIDWAVANVFSPIRSEEDRFVDQVNEVMKAEELYSLDRHARALYRAGVRFIEEAS